MERTDRQMTEPSEMPSKHHNFMNPFIIKAHLKVTATPVSPEHPDNSFLIFDSNEDGVDDALRVLIFASADMRFKASIATELFADGTYRVVPRGFATLYTIHSVVDGVPYPVFFCLTKNEREDTFMRVLSVAKPFLTKFDTSCIVHTDCQRSAINAFRRTFGGCVRGRQRQCTASSSFSKGSILR